jgi:F-type H+-transporting ATPase subunit b
MPQIAQLADTYASQVFWLLIFFGFTFFVIGMGMVPKIMGTVELRDAQISGDLAAAQAARDAANAQEEAWKKRESDNRAAAQAVVAAAKGQAAKETEAKLAEAQGGIDVRIAEAEAEISAARNSAMAEIEGVAAEAAQDIVARIAGAKVDKRTARAAVKEALAHG